MIAVSYERVSSEMQLDGHSLDAQREGNTSLISRRGWRFGGSYRDEAASAKTTDRPAFQRMLRDAEAGLFQVIVVHRLDRFSRSVTDMLLTMRDLERRGVTVVSATEDFDFTTPIGRVLLTLLAAFAEWYLNNLAEETKKGHRARVAKGRQNAQLPYGYIRNEGGEAIPSEEQAAIVQWMFEEYATGNSSATEIASALNLRGVAPPGRGRRKDARPTWTKDSIADMLRNRFYLGEVRYHDEWHQGAHEAIISQALFDQAEQSRKHRSNKRVSAGRRSLQTYLCSGLVRCSYCGESMRVTSNKKGSDQKKRWHSYYTCSWKERQTGCPRTKTTHVTVADEQLGEYLCSLQLPADWQQALLERAQQHAADTPDVQSLRKQRAALGRQLEKLKNLYLLEDMSDEDYASERQRLLTEIARLEHEAMGENPADLKRAAELLANFRALWEEATLPERKALVRSIVAEIYLNENGLDRVVVKPAFARLL